MTSAGYRTNMFKNWHPDPLASILRSGWAQREQSAYRYARTRLNRDWIAMIRTENVKIKRQ